MAANLKCSRNWACFFLIFTVLTLSGCSVSSISEKIFGKGKVEAKISPDYLLTTQDQFDKAVIRILNQATKTIYIEQYELDRKDFTDILIAKAKKGVEVKILLDQSPKSAKSTYDYLRANGVGVQFYPTEKGQFSKAKLLAVDSARAIIGGNDWTMSAASAHDVALELDGRAAWKTSEVFSRDWKRATTLDLKLPESPQADDQILLATNANIQSQVIRQVQDAKTSIQIEIPVLTYPVELINMLADAAAAGKKVQVLLDAQMEKNNQSTVNKLQSSGVQVRFYPVDDKQKLSAKFAVFDESVSVLGSSNWSRSSFVQYHELDVFVPSKALSQKLLGTFNTDWEKSTPAKKN